MTEISAAGVVGAPAASLFDHLADLRTHWELASGRVLLLEPDAAATRGGRVRMRGPFGVGRDATTEVVRAKRPNLLEGRARVGGATEALIRWRLEEISADATRVELSARLIAAGRWDRLVLAVGGRRWLEHLFARVIRRLEVLGPALSEAVDARVEAAVALEGAT